MNRRNFLKLASSIPFIGALLPGATPDKLEVLRGISMRLNGAVHWVVTGKEVIWYKGVENAKHVMSWGR